MKKTKIEWTDTTWNPVWGCNGGCEYCYARGIAKRFGKQMAIKNWGEFSQNIKLITRQIQDFKPTFLPYNYNTLFPNKPTKIFVDSMSDIAFWGEDLIKIVINRIKRYPQHIFQILTKFPEKIVGIEFPDNVWLGITSENQTNLMKRFKTFMQIKAGKHFISFEPLHSNIYLDLAYFHYCSMSVFDCRKKVNKIDWIIVGGETGAKAKPMHTDWVRNIQNYCKKYNVPFFFKSWGAWSQHLCKAKNTTLAIKNSRAVSVSNEIGCDELIMYKVGKKYSGRELEGKTYNEFPEL